MPFQAKQIIPHYNKNILFSKQIFLHSNFFELFIYDSFDTHFCMAKIRLKWFFECPKIKRKFSDVKSNPIWILLFSNCEQSQMKRKVSFFYSNANKYKPFPNCCDPIVLTNGAQWQFILISHAKKCEEMKNKLNCLLWAYLLSVNHKAAIQIHVWFLLASLPVPHSMAHFIWSSVGKVSLSLFCFKQSISHNLACNCFQTVMI